MRTLSICILLSCLVGEACAQQPSVKPIVIAHRGASGYLPEHTEAAKALAVAQGADYIEQDVVLSRDKIFIVCHDIQLQHTTDVAEKFPDRKRADGAWYAFDFDWAEIAQLSVIERRNKDERQAFPQRFPGGFHQRMVRLDDELTMLRGLEHTLGRKLGIYVELKGPAWYRQHGQIDMSALLLKKLAEHGYTKPNDRCFIQCFEHEELTHLKQDLHCQLPLIALMGGRLPEQKALQEQLTSVAEVAYGVGPSLDMLVRVDRGEIVTTGFVETAHAVGLKVHPYTVRKDGLPKWAASVDQLHSVLIEQLKVDGFFTDFPDLGRRAVDRLTDKH